MLSTCVRVQPSRRGRVPHLDGLGKSLAEHDHLLAAEIGLEATRSGSSRLPIHSIKLAAAGGFW